MYEDIIPLLRCPICKKSLKLKAQEIKNHEVITGELLCSCPKAWKIRDSVLDFEVEEQEMVNRWSELTKDKTFEELDEIILSQTPKNQIDLLNKAKDFIVQNIDEKKPKFVLDIATGRGSLLNRLVQDLVDESMNLICTDLSFTVLKADREKILKLNPKIKVNFISCDATNLPINDNGIDLVVSFLGIANMEEKTLDGLKEAYRILKRENELLNCILFIKKDTEGYNTLKAYYNSKGFHQIESFLLKNEAMKVHSDVGFEQAEFINIGESFGEKNDLDLLPFEGEWFQIGIVRALKS